VVGLDLVHRFRRH